MSSIEAVEYVFKILAATYGASWDRSMGTAPLADVKSAWSFALSGYTHSNGAKRSIMWALQNLPERVPNAREFVALCRQAPHHEPVLQLESPVANPERMAIELAKLEPIRHARPTEDRGEWARRILRRHESGEKISPTVVQMARDGLAELGLALQ